MFSGNTSHSDWCSDAKTRTTFIVKSWGRISLDLRREILARALRRRFRTPTTGTFFQLRHSMHFIQKQRFHVYFEILAMLIFGSSFFLENGFFSALDFIEASQPCQLRHYRSSLDRHGSLISCTSTQRLLRDSDFLFFCQSLITIHLSQTCWLKLCFPAEQYHVSGFGFIAKLYYRFRNHFALPIAGQEFIRATNIRVWQSNHECEFETTVDAVSESQSIDHQCFGYALMFFFLFILVIFQDDALSLLYFGSYLCIFAIGFSPSGLAGNLMDQQTIQTFETLIYTHQQRLRSASSSSSSSWL